MEYKDRYTEWSGEHGAGRPGKDCYTQLAKYEDSELSPEEVMQLAKRKSYVLHGYWNTPDTDGVQIIKISYDIAAVEKRLREITESNAAEFVNLLEENWQAVGGDRFYEITDGDGNYAKFYITEEVADYEG